MGLSQIAPLLIISVLARETYFQDISGWQSHYLGGYRFIPILGHCYQLYYTDDLIPSCRREPDLENQSCIRWTSSDHSCLGLTTPTNETVVFRCTTHIRFDTCFEVYDTNQNLDIVCQEIFQDHAVGIKTPDNFTILFHSDLCRTVTNIMEREIYRNFVNNFSLDVETRSCYKVYGQEEVVSPYNCLSTDISDACVFNIEHGCTALTTTNNEVLLLDCPDEELMPKEKDCFFLYSSDNEVHTVCQETLEERCVGVITPSNLTVLFECFFCSEFMNLVYYNKEAQKKQRQFVKNYLADENLRKNLHSIGSGYITFNDNQFDDIIYAHWIPRTSCFGVTLESNETIFLECAIQSENQEPPGCFSLVSAENEKQSICSEVLNEVCVGLKTSRNVSVALACYGSGSEQPEIITWNLYSADSLENNFVIHIFVGDYKAEFDAITHFLLQSFHNFLTDSYHFRHSYDAYNEVHNSSAQRTTYSVQHLEEKPGCSGLKIENEIVVLECSNMKIKGNGCFNVIKTSQVNVGQEVDSVHEIEETCVKIVDENCVGIITPNNWTLPFDCFSNFGYTSGQVTTEGSGQVPTGGYAPGRVAAEGPQSGFISENIPNRNPPPRL